MDADIEPEIYEDPSRGPYWVGLWAVARHWVGSLADIFEPDVIAGPGIARRFALRCRNWLWPIEGLVRRLIIAAAMKLDLTQLPKRTAGRKRPSKPTASSVSFAVLPHITGRRPSSSRTTQPAKPEEHRHIGFPGDDLLRLFPRSDRRNARPVHSGRSHPLHRRGRRSRWDPDYEGSGSANTICEGDVVYTSFMLHGRSLTPLDGRARPEPRLRTRADRSSPYWKPPGGDLPEWKRLEQEWARVIPSRGRAGRINALLRVMQAPERWVARTARKLSADLVARLHAAPPPRLKKPKLDRSPSGFLEEPLGQSHALIDTS
jgi:hypothetical protein